MKKVVALISAFILVLIFTNGCAPNKDGFFKRIGSSWVYFINDGRESKATGLKIKIEKNINSEEHENIYSAISADGQKVAYIQKPAWPHRIFIANIDGSDVKELVGPNKAPVHLTIENQLAWSGSNKSVIYSTTVNDCGPDSQGSITKSMYKIDITNKKKELINEDENPCTNNSSKSKSNSRPKTIKQFTYIKKVFSNDNVNYIKADYAQWLTGKEGIKAAKEDGKLSPDGILDNDYYIRNKNPKQRTLEIDDSVIISISKASGELAQKKITLKAFKDIYASNRFDNQGYQQSPFWLTLEGNKITKITQQYVP